MTTDNLVRFLTSLYSPYASMPSAHVEIRTFKPAYAIEPGQNPAGPREWFPNNERGFIAAAESVAKWRETTDVYYGVLPRVKGGGKAEHVRVAGCIWADIDAGDETFDDAAGLLIDTIKEKNLLRPHVIVRSGGGLHAYWRLTDPVPCTTRADQNRLRDVMIRLVRLIGGEIEHAHACPKANDVARVLRLPDSYNHKIEGEPRPVELLRVYEGDVPRSLTWWEGFLPSIPLPPPYSPPERSERHGRGDVQGWNQGRRYPGQAVTAPSLYPATVAKLTTPAPDGRKHYTMVEVAVAARKNGMDEQAILNFAEQVGIQAGVNMNDPNQQRHLLGVVDWTMRTVTPDAPR